MRRLLGVLLVLATASQAAAQARIPEVKTSARTPCEVHPETAVETAELWLIARSALESSIAIDSNPPLLLIRKWRRTLTRSLGLMSEQLDTSRVVTRQPFGVKPPSNLERVGYVQRMLRSVVFYGPDPDEIVTERFLRQHCFRRVEGSGGTQGLAGLVFDPLPRQQNPDVSGTLWVEPVSGALRYVEYSWTNTPSWAGDGKAHGRTDFARLATGGWVIQRWYIRMPRLGVGYYDTFEGYIDEGGELLAVGPPSPRRK